MTFVDDRHLETLVQKKPGVIVHAVDISVFHSQLSARQLEGLFGESLPVAVIFSVSHDR